MINKLDFLSPPITLFYLERRTHTSKIGGSLILLLISICSAYIIYLLFLIIEHRKVTSIFYKKFQYDIGQYFLNSSSIFYFIQFHSIDNESFKYKYASKYLRIYSYFGNTEFDESRLDKIDHWVYDSCIDGVDNKDLDSNLLQNINNFNNSACLRYYYSSSEDKYYLPDSNKFKWPFLAHGTAQKNNIFLHTTIQKCTNDSVINKVFGQCPTQIEIDEYVSKLQAIFLYLVDNQVDPTNYKNPIQQYIQSITSGIGSIKDYEENYIFYSPLKVKTKEGSIFENNHYLESLYYDSNVKLSSPNVENYFKLSRFTHFLQNNIQIYERRYDDITEILSNLGGIIQCIFNIFYWINYFYNKFIVLSDTNSLFFSNLVRRANTLTGEKFNSKINILNNKNNNNNLKDSSINGFQEDSKSNTIIFRNLANRTNNDSQMNINEENINENNFKDNSKNNLKYNLFKFKKAPSYKMSHFRNNTFKENRINSININNNTSNIFVINKNKELHYHTCKKANIYYNNNLGLKKKSIQENIDSDLNLDRLKNNLANQTIQLSQYFNNNIKLSKSYSFYEFLKSVFTKKENTINFIIRYRKRLLSEEHVLKSHINTIILENKLSIDKYQNINISENLNDI